MSKSKKNISINNQENNTSNKNYKNIAINNLTYTTSSNK